MSIWYLTVTKLFFFLPKFGLGNSQPRASSLQSYNNYQLGRVKMYTCFLRDMSPSFQTAAHTASHGSVTHSEVSNIYPPLHIQAHRGSWLYISSKRMQWLHVSWRNHLLDSLLQVGIRHAIRYNELVWRKKEVHKMSPDQGQTKWKMCLMLDTSAFLSRFLEWTGCEQAVCVSGCDHRWTVLLFLLLSAQHAGPEIVLHSRQPT